MLQKWKKSNYSFQGKIGPLTFTRHAAMTIFILWFTLTAQLLVHSFPAGDRGNIGQQYMSRNWCIHGNQQGCPANFAVCHSLSDTTAQHVFPTTISQKSTFYSEKSSHKINKSKGKNLSFVNNTHMRFWATQNGKKNYSNKAEMLNHSRIMLSHTIY